MISTYAVKFEGDEKAFEYAAHSMRSYQRKYPQIQVDGKTI